MGPGTHQELLARQAATRAAESVNAEYTVNDSGEKLVQRWKGRAVVFFRIISVFPEGVDNSYRSHQ